MNDDMDKFEKEIVFGSVENHDAWIEQFKSAPQHFYLASDTWAERLWRRIRWSRAVHIPLERIAHAWWKIKRRLHLT